MVHIGMCVCNFIFWAIGGIRMVIALSAMGFILSVLSIIIALKFKEEITMGKIMDYAEMAKKIERIVLEEGVDYDVAFERVKKQAQGE